MTMQTTINHHEQSRQLFETEWYFQYCVEAFARELLKTVKCYICPVCEEKHGCYNAAAECCPREPDEAHCYECPNCSKLYDKAADAYLCCEENQTELPPSEGLLYQIEHNALEAFGQTRLFN